MFKAITVANAATASAWINLAEFYALANDKKEADSAALGQLVWPASFDQASVTLEFADDVAGTNGGALYDIDGTTVLSTIVKPATGKRTSLSPAKFSIVQWVRVVLPAAASQDWTFRVGIRKAS